MATSPVPSRYAHLTRLGEGAFGVVFQAQDTRLNRTIAIKVLKAGVDDESLKRFLDEARAQAALTHPNVVTVFDISSTDDAAFITMEFAPGGTVADPLTGGSRYSPARTAAIITDAAAGLDHAHGHGLIHRDIKPSNLLVADDGRVMVADFGLAREMGRETTNFAGTTVYMAPEQMQVGKNFTPATDVFALAVTAYELLTGRHHGGFPALSTGNTPPDVNLVIEGINPAVDTVLAAALHLYPTRRTATPVLFADQLANALAEQAQRPVAPRATPAEIARPTEEPPYMRTAVGKRVSTAVLESARVTEGLTCIGVEWSGSAKERDAAKSIWTAVVRDGALVSLTTGRGRRATAEFVIDQASDGGELVVGMDFAFSAPYWYLQDQGLEDAPALWDIMDGTERKEGRESQWIRALPPPFWGPHVRLKPELNDGQTWFRKTEDETRQYTRVNPKSVFQLTGAGSVGGQSMRGMPILKFLRENGFAIWPMDAPANQMVVEVYPRALLQWLRPGTEGVAGAEARAAFLTDAPSAFWRDDPDVRSLLHHEGSAFDAAVSAWALWVGRDALATLPDAADTPFRQEGRIWLPPPESTLRPGARQPLRAGASHPSVAGSPAPGSAAPAAAAQEQRIANPHFGNVGDVFKHLLLVEIARQVQPSAYIETHAGAPVYPLEAMRRGPGDALRFAEYATQSRILQESTYATLETPEMHDRGRYLGSSALVARTLGADAKYVFFDEHAETTARLTAMLHAMGLPGRAITGDGLSGALQTAGAGSLTLIDPFRISAKGDGGMSSADVFTVLARADDRTTVLWYPVVVPKMKQVWPDQVALNVPEPIWRAEVRLPASAPGLNGCGVLVAGISDEAAEGLGVLVDALGAALTSDFSGTAVGHGWDTENGPFSPWTPYGVYRER